MCCLTASFILRHVFFSAVWTRITYCIVQHGVVAFKLPAPPVGLVTQFFIGRNARFVFQTEPIGAGQPQVGARIVHQFQRISASSTTRFFARLKLYDPATGLSSRRFSRTLTGYLIWDEPNHTCRLGEVRK